jgi:hypothetical protein
MTSKTFKTTLRATLRGALKGAVLAGGLALATGCAAPADDTVTGPRVMGLSTVDIVVGESLGLYGHNLNAEGVQTRITFNGNYYTDDGQQEVVHLTFVPDADGELTVDGETFDAMRLPRFGPFNNPFSSSDRPGTFNGQIIAETEDADGVVTTDAKPLALALDVGPSLIIETFAPVMFPEEGGVEPVDCGAPALRALGGVPYYLEVRPVGIKAVRFEYEFSRINGSDGAVWFTHEPDQVVATDVLGDVEMIMFNPVPNDERFYVAGIRVVAYDAEGNSVETALPMTVHRPIEIEYDGNYEIAERYEPVPVSGCIPGSVGSRATYSESRTETRQRSVSVTMSSTFSQQAGVTRSMDYREGISEGNSRSRSLAGTEREEESISESQNLTYSEDESTRVGLSTMDGESWGWNTSQGLSDTESANRSREVYGEVNGSVTGTASGEAGIPLLAKGKVSTSATVGVRAGGGVGWGGGNSHTVTSDEGYNMGGSRAETRSFGSTVNQGRTQSLGGSYALARSNSRTVTDSENLSNTRTWDMSQGVSENETISESQEVARNTTIVESSSDQTVQSYGGIIPRNQFGIFYRQTTRWVRRAEVKAYNLCGLTRHMGELQFNEWTWAPDLAIGPTCDGQPPASELPAAVCLIEPCGG